jgi:hypothetical protein
MNHQHGRGLYACRVSRFLEWAARVDRRRFRKWTEAVRHCPQIPQRPLATSEVFLAKCSSRGFPST